MQRDGFSSRTAPYGAVLYSHMSCGKRRWVLLQNAAAGGVLYSHIPVERRWVLLQNGALRRRSVLAYVLWKEAMGSPPERRRRRRSVLAYSCRKAMGSPPERRLTAPFCTRICPVERGDGFSSRTPPQAAFC